MSRPASDSSLSDSPTTLPETEAEWLDQEPPSSPLFLQPSSPQDTWNPQEESSEIPSESPSTSPAGGSPSDRPSTGKAKIRELLPTTRAAVKTAGGVAHSVLTAGDVAAQEAGLYLPDRDDVEAIATPLAGLASRRMPEGAENPDITDLIGLAMGFIGYAIKQRTLRAQLYAAPVYAEPVEQGPEWAEDQA